MSNAARMRPEGDQAAVVISVRGAALRDAEVGLALSLCLLLALAPSHPNWKGAGIFMGIQATAAVYVGVRAASRFRSRLDDAVSLPTEAVEALGRTKRPPLDRKGALVGGAMLIAATGALFTFGWSRWEWDVVAAAVGALIANGLVRPLATAYFAARWECAHGRARLFRPFLRDAEDTETLYVAERPVPTA
jgi:hypothetical protein